MLGYKTKQLNVYGKRGTRIIDASDDANGTSVTRLTNIFDDKAAVPPPNTFASRMKKHENSIAPEKPRAVLSKVVVGLQQKKRRLSPVLSPVRKPQVKQALAKGELEPKGLAKKMGAQPGGIPSPRAPFSVRNMTNSPSATRLLKKSRVTSALGTPTKRGKAFVPFVDVDISVLDDDGRTISTEHRLTKPRSSATKALSDDSESDSQVKSQLRRPKRQTANRKRIVISDSEADSDSDQEYAEEEHVLEQKAPSRRPKVVSSKTVSPKPAKRASRFMLDVLVPRASYKIVLPEAKFSPQFKEEPTLPDLPDATIASEPSRTSLVASPAPRARPLTPIRNKHRRLYEPPSPPSPTTPTDLDFSLDLEEFKSLSLLDNQSLSEARFDAPEHLKGLLEECHQETCGPHNFSAFIETFPLDPVLQSARLHSGEQLKFRKIGEASYSEVFGIGDVVLKVIPLRDEANSSSNDESDGPAPSDAGDVRKEIVVTRAMGEVHDGFVELLKTYVVRGRYPEVLLNLWDEYHEERGSESIRPDNFRVSQVYAIIVLPNGGPDLEAYTFSSPTRTGWRQAASIFWQVTKALAHAENLVSFEHRDLHWGQILVRNANGQSNASRNTSINQKARSKLHRALMDDPSHGVAVTVIDLGLSRMDAGDGKNNIHWTPFDEEVFEGQGDYQFDVYRLMKGAAGGAWSRFHPITNVLWLHYLLQKLLSAKGLKPPGASRKSAKGAEVPLVPTLEPAFTEKDCYDCLVDLEHWLAQRIVHMSSTMAPAKKPRGKQAKTSANATATATSGSSSPARAGEIVAYGVKMGWVKTTRPF